MNCKVIVDIIKDLDDLLSYKDQWNIMYSNKKYSSFQSFSYNYFSWKNILSRGDNRLYIILVKKDDKLISICPFYLDNESTLRFINDVHADFCDILLEEEFNLDEILSNLPFIKKYSFINLLKVSNLLRVLKYDNYNFSSLTQERRSAYLFLKKGSFPDNYDRFRSKQKSEFRRICKRYTDCTHLLLTYKECTFPLEDIRVLRSKMIDLKLRNKYFLDHSLLDLIYNLYIEEELVISLVKDKEGIHAISFILVKDLEYLVWIDLYDDLKMINLFNYISLFSLLSYDNSINIHLGRGDYSYKMNNFLPDIDDLIKLEVFFNWIDFTINNIASYMIRGLRFFYQKIIKWRYLFF